MKTSIQELVIEGVTYVPKDSQKQATNTEGLPAVLIRTYSAGVHFGYLKRREGKEVELVNTRRVWYWDESTEDWEYDEIE